MPQKAYVIDSIGVMFTKTGIDKSPIFNNIQGFRESLVSAGCGQAKAAPGLPPARAELSVRAVVCHAAGARRPTPPLVAALQWRSFGLSLSPLCCASSPLATPARCVPWDWSPREAFCSPAHPCCSSSLETTQCNPLVAPASRPEAHAPLPMARHGSPP